MGASALLGRVAPNTPAVLQASVGSADRGTFEHARARHLRAKERAEENRKLNDDGEPGQDQRASERNPTRLLVLRHPEDVPHDEKRGRREAGERHDEKLAPRVALGVVAEEKRRDQPLGWNVDAAGQMRADEVRPTRAGCRRKSQRPPLR